MTIYYAKTNVLCDEPMEDVVISAITTSYNSFHMNYFYEVRVHQYGETWFPWHDNRSLPQIGKLSTLHKPVAGILYVTGLFSGEKTTHNPYE